MAVVALITWVVAAGRGSYMLSMWVRAGGDAGTTTHFREPLTYGHFLLAAVGLVLWIIYVIAGGQALAWIAFVLLLVVAVLGETMFLPYYKERQRILASAREEGTGRSDAGTTTTNRASAVQLAELRIPFSVALVHGLFAVITVVLVLLVALGVGN